MQGNQLWQELISGTIINIYFLRLTAVFIFRVDNEDPDAEKIFLPLFPGLNAEGWVNGNPEEPVGCVLGFAPKVNTPGVLPVKLKLVVLLPNWNAEPELGAALEPKPGC